MSGWFCIKCSGNHPTHLCEFLNKPSQAPLETPSHNGPYLGTVPVRELAPGVSGSEWTNPAKYAKTIGAHIKKFTIKCQECGEQIQVARESQKFCSRPKRCRSNWHSRLSNTKNRARDERRKREKHRAKAQKTIQEEGFGGFD